MAPPSAGADNIESYVNEDGFKPHWGCVKEKMEATLGVIAFVLFMASIINIFILPLGIEKPRNSYSGDRYILDLILSVMTIFVCGHILGWW